MCHAYALRGPVAGIPSLQRCDGCHKLVGRDKPAIQRLEKAVEDQKPIEWKRIYRLPDHVRFVHERHLAAGIRCQTCHGEVQTMDVLGQATPLTIRGDAEASRRAAVPLRACGLRTGVFGDADDPESRIAKVQRDPRGYSVLGDLNTLPAITYLAKVREEGT